jgi:hypothetical protein
MLLASPQSVTVGEVLAFFPPFLQDLSQFAKADAARISPESVQASLGSNNHLANRKFVLYSAVGIATGA